MVEQLLHVRKWNEETDTYVNVSVIADVQKRRVLGKRVFFHLGLEGDEGYWVMSDYETGGKICQALTKQSARLKCLEIIERVGTEAFIQTIDETKRKHGIANPLK